MVFMAGGFLFVLEPVAASDLADLGALGISVPGKQGERGSREPSSAACSSGHSTQRKGG